MSLSAVNMCRLVIAVIFISFVSCVLAETETPEPKKNETCSNSPLVKKSQKELMICLNDIVALHLNSSIAPGLCRNATDFGEKLNSHASTVKTVCSTTAYNTTDFINFLEFSLRNESFKKFYEDISCVKNLEVNISNSCVKNFVGRFNITEKRKHTSWYSKANLHYSGHTCSTSTSVKNCVDKLLSQCHNSREYVASLFKYARELADCTLLESNLSTIPPASGNGAVPSASWALPVIITLSIGAVVVVIGNSNNHNYSFKM